MLEAKNAKLEAKNGCCKYVHVWVYKRSIGEQLILTNYIKCMHVVAGNFRASKINLVSLWDIFSHENHITTGITFHNYNYAEKFVPKK